MRKSLDSKYALLGAILIAPTVLVFATVIVYPLVSAIYLSVFSIYTPTMEGEFNGFDNYSRLLASAEFWRSLLNNVVWTAGTLVLQIGFGIAVALLLHRNILFRSLARSLVLFPYFLSTVVAVLVWRWLFNDLYGVLNHMLLWAHIVDVPVDWLGSMPNAMISLILVGAWKYFPFVVIAVLARLQSIPVQLYEAATIDGAGRFAQFRDITLPQLKDVLIVIVLLRTIWDFKEFDLIYLLTGGGPVISTQTLPLMVYKEAFALNQMGGASAVAVLMMLIMLVFHESVSEEVEPLMRRMLFNVFAWFVVLVITFPLLWMILTSLKPQSELFQIPPSLLPSEVTFEHYRRLLAETPFLTYMKNSLWLAGATTVVVIVIATLGAHSLVRFSYPGRERLARMVLFTYLLPSVVLIIPLYFLMIRIGLANTLASLVIAYTTFALPYALWLLRSFMAAIPDDLEAAALVDGATRMQAFVDVILPQALPGIISTALFTSILAWNEYLFALVLVNSDEVRPLTTGVMNILITSFNIEWSLLMAASVMMSVPLIVIFMFLQRFLTSGFGAGAVKG